MHGKQTTERSLKTYMSIRQAAQATGLGESYIRKGVKERMIPGFYVAGQGSKFMVNVPLLLDQLEKQSQGNISGDIAGK